MCNWLLKFKGGVWLTVFCETEAEAIALAYVAEESTDLVWDFEVICLG